MPILIAGYIDFAPEATGTLIQDAKDLIAAALREKGCLAYAWSLDPLVPGRIHVFEEWTDEEALAGHFRDPAYAEMGAHLNAAGILGLNVKKYRADLSEPVYDDAGVPRPDFFTAQDVT